VLSICSKANLPLLSSNPQYPITAGSGSQASQNILLHRKAMLITVLKSKISYAVITDKSLHYEGSITIDEDIMDAAALTENEQVHVVNLNNGERLTTYVIRGPRGSRCICLNGPAARKGEVGDTIFILSYVQIDPAVEQLSPQLVRLESDA
jgi:aspartate 1-decarboxylase